MDFFDGKKVRDEILTELKEKVSEMDTKPVLAVFWIGENEVSGHYVAIKKKVAENLGVKFRLIKMDATVAEEEVLKKIDELNHDSAVKGIMTQIPLPKHIDQKKVIEAIDPEKDVDGLRYCMGMESSFMPPVVLAILDAIRLSGKKIEESEIAVIGHGFLVGAPLVRAIDGRAKTLAVANSGTEDISDLTKNADIVVSATGVPHIITGEMVKDGAVLIDAGTSEVSGELKGDIDPEAFKKASYYTPVPGGIGPVTIAMLLKNLTEQL